MNSHITGATRNIEVSYDGSYPNLCAGNWTILIDGEKVSFRLEGEWSELRGSMNTRGTYSRWYFDDNWSEQTEEYKDGYIFSEWCKLKFAKNIKKQYNLSNEEMQILYDKISEHDFRYSSCGGCI